MAVRPISSAARVPISGFWYPGTSARTRFEGAVSGESSISSGFEKASLIAWRGAGHFGFANPNSKSLAIAEQECLEFVHRDERNDARRIEADADCPNDILQECLLHHFGFRLDIHSRDLLAARPNLGADTWQPVEVYHRGRDAPGVLPQVIHYCLAYLRPRFDPTSLPPLPRISNESSTDRGVSAIAKMGRQQFVDELLFGLPLDMYEQPGHGEDCRPLLSGDGRPPSSFFSQSCPRL